ncbi:MAG TPA: BatD family protein [Thermoanaerobaculia bacterium]|nr:BatD family protein [Thermoanaerobaculia bacterium]
MPPLRGRDGAAALARTASACHAVACPTVACPASACPLAIPLAVRLVILVIPVILVMAPAPLAASPFAVNVSLAPAVIGLDETATLTIEASGGGLGSFRFTPHYALENLEAVEGPSRFDDFTLINGSLSHSSRYSLRLRPLGPGPARVRSLSIAVNGQLVRLPDQEIRVQEAPTGQAGGAAPRGARRPAPETPEPEDLIEQFFGSGSPFSQAPRPQGPAAFVRAEVEPAQPRQGEQAVYTIYLYTRQDVAAINATDMPSFRGFWVRDLPQPEHLVPEMVNVGAERYGRVAMIRKALFALRPGHHVLEPAGCDVVVEPPSRGFFGPPPRPMELHLRTLDVTVDVQPLPPAPAGFGGLVGQVSLAAKLQPYKLHLGDGATLAVTLSGAGHLEGVAAPRLEVPPGLTVFPPQQQSEDHVNGGTVVGRRTWTFVIVPSRSGIYSVKPLGVSYFDPVHGQYRVAESPALALMALPAPPAAAAAGGAAAGGSAAAAQSSRRGAALPGRERFAWPWQARGWPGLLPWLAALAAVVVVVLVVALILARRRRRPRPDEPAVAATAPAGAAAGAGTQPGEVEQKLREAAREERPRQAAALVEEGWRGYLARHCGLPATTPAARWGAVLAAQGMASDVADEVTRLAEELHYLRYAPQLSTTGAVRDEMLARSRQLLRRLR